MKQIYALSLVAVSIVVGACDTGQPVPDTTPNSTQIASNASVSELGSQKIAGPYAVVLMTPQGELTPGNAPFMAHVTKGGKDIDNAKVNLDLTMPSMNMDGQHVELKHTAGDAYEGTAAVMAIPYEAKVDVEGPDGKGTADFQFTVK